VSSSHHHRSAFYIPICCACAGKKANVTRENKEEKEEKSHPKKVPFACRAGVEKGLFVAIRKQTRGERNIWRRKI
jgi:hypothetical protein